MSSLMSANIAALRMMQAMVTSVGILNAEKLMLDALYVKCLLKVFTYGVKDVLMEVTIIIYLNGSKLIVSALLDVVISVEICLKNE